MLSQSGPLSPQALGADSRTPPSLLPTLCKSTKHTLHTLGWGPRTCCPCTPRVGARPCSLPLRVLPLKGVGPPGGPGTGGDGRDSSQRHLRLWCPHLSPPPSGVPAVVAHELSSHPKDGSNVLCHQGWLPEDGLIWRGSVDGTEAQRSCLPCMWIFPKYCEASHPFTHPPAPFPNG